MNILNLSILTLISACTLLDASDNWAKISKLSSLINKKYEIGYEGSHHASSPSFFAITVTDSDNKQTMVYDRTREYRKHVQYKGHIEKRMSNASIAILLDRYIITGQDYNAGLWVDPIATPDKSKNIKLPACTWYGAKDVETLHTIPHNPMTLALLTNCAGLLVMDVLTEQVTHAYKTSIGKTIAKILPDKAGTGIWYTTADFDAKKFSVAHYDMRSGNTTVVATVSEWITNISINPSNTHCALLADEQLLVYDVAEQKRDQTIPLQEGRSTFKSFFANDDLLVYHSGKSDSGLGNAYDQKLHGFSLIKGSISTITLDKNVCGIDYHHNTGLLIGSRHVNGNTIYDSGAQN